MRKKVLCIYPVVHETGMRMLEESVDVLITTDTRMESLLPLVQDVNAIYVLGPGRVTAEIIENAPRLEVISAAGSGVDNIDVAAAAERAIPVVHAPGVGATPVAEFTIGAMLALARNVIHHDRDLRQGAKWDDRMSRMLGTELEGKTLGIVGLGHIGSMVARKCRAAFDMNVVAYDPYIPPDKAQQVGAALLDNLADLLKATDFVSLHVRLTPETRGMIGREELDLMKPSAYLINTSRGPVVDQAALAEALESKRIAGAAIDVFDPEPPASDDPLFRLNNAIVTSHVAGVTQETKYRLATNAAAQILQVLRGERPSFMANPEVWDRFLERRRREAGSMASA